MYNCTYVYAAINQIYTSFFLIYNFYTNKRYKDTIKSKKKYIANIHYFVRTLYFLFILKISFLSQGFTQHKSKNKCIFFPIRNTNFYFFIRATKYGDILSYPTLEPSYILTNIFIFITLI